MAKRKSEQDDVSLFPFLSILACVIGTLTLMISALALGQMDNPTVASAEEYEKVKAELEKAQAEIDALQKKLNDEKENRKSELGDQQLQLFAQEEKLEEIDEEVAAAQAALAKIQPPEIVAPVDQKSHAEAMKELKTELAETKKQVAQLDKQITEKKLPPEESEVSILPSGSGVGFEPIFIECAVGQVVLHTKAKPESIRIGDLKTHKSFLAILEEVLKDEKKSIIFLVRSDALNVYNTARSHANTVGAKNGKLPIIGQGRIDLSHFHKKK